MYADDEVCGFVCPVNISGSEVKGRVTGRMGCDVCWDGDAGIGGGIGGTV